MASSSLHVVVSSAGYAGRLDDLAQLVANKLGASRPVVEAALRAEGIALVEAADRATAEAAVRELGAAGITARVRGLTQTSSDERIERTMMPGWTSAFAGEDDARRRHEKVHETGLRTAIPNALFDSSPRPPARPDDTVVSREQLREADFPTPAAPADSVTIITREPAPIVPPAPDAPVDSSTLVSREPLLPPPDDSATVITRSAALPEIAPHTMAATPIAPPSSHRVEEPPSAALGQAAPWSAALDAIRRNQQARPVAAAAVPTPPPPVDNPPASADGDSPWKAVLGPAFAAPAQPADSRAAAGRDQTTFVMGTGDETLAPGARQVAAPQELELPAAVVAPPLEQPIGVRARRAAQPAPGRAAADAPRAGEAMTTWVLGATALIVLAIAVAMVVAATRHPAESNTNIGPAPALIGATAADAGAVTPDSGAATPDTSTATADEIDELLVRAERACNRARFVECRELANSALQLDESNRDARLLHIRAVTGLASEGSSTPPAAP